VERLAECGEKLVLMQSLGKEGSRAEVGRGNAPKNAVEACPWAVKVADFDFATQQSFRIWGFPSLAAAWQFADMWERAEMQQLWELRHRKPRGDLLGRWAFGGDVRAKVRGSPRRLPFLVRCSVFPRLETGTKSRRDGHLSQPEMNQEHQHVLRLHRVAQCWGRHLESAQEASGPYVPAGGGALE